MPSTVMDGSLKRIECPRCKQPTRLDGFAVIVHEDGTWSTGEPDEWRVECPWDCGARYIVEHGKVRYIP